MAFTFGDFEAADAFDIERTIAPEQVARFLRRLRLRHGGDDDAIAAALVAWLIREGPR